jgi:hypothetical protein
LNDLKFEAVALDDLSGGFMRNLEDFSRNGGVIEIGDLKNVTFVKEVFQKHGILILSEYFIKLLFLYVLLLFIYRPI